MGIRPLIEGVPMASGRRPRTRQTLRMTALMAVASATLVATAQSGYAQDSGATVVPAAGASARVDGPSASSAGAADSLWVLSDSSNQLGVCGSPRSAAALDSCFGSTTQYSSGVWRIATDGTNVYITLAQGGYSCPIADLGANCAPIMAGGWGGIVGGIAAADGFIWVGQRNGAVYQCPNNLPYAPQSTAPSACTQLASLGYSVDSMLLANGTLYVGTTSGPQSGTNGVMACDPYAAGSCVQLDWPDSEVVSLAAGAGYLWAGLANGILWRCDPTQANACQNWDKGGGGIYSLSYDGQGTVYASVNTGSRTKPGTIWACSASQQNGCSNYLDVGPRSGGVAAGNGTVFAGNGNGLFVDKAPYLQARSGWGVPNMLYIPAAGPTGVGAVSVRSARGPWLRKLNRQCQSAGGPRNARVTFKVSGPHGLVMKDAVPLRGQSASRVLKSTFDLLDPGSYDVVAQGRGSCGGKKFTKKITTVAMVEKDRTAAIDVKYARQR